MRKLLTVVVFLIVGLTSIALIALFVYGLWDHYRFGVISPLAAGARGHTYKEVEADFRDRVRDAFPLGTPVAKMLSELERQGFVQRAGQLRGGSAMVLDRPGFPCEDFWEVSWTTGSSQTIQSIDADISPRCF